MSRAPDTNGWVALSDAEWMNIVNHEHAYESMSKDDAVHAAVKATEEKLRQINVAANSPTLRDYFAAKALSTVAGYPAEDVSSWMPQHFAGHAYAIADAMLVERAK